MKLTQQLLSFLNRVFDKDPKAFVAMRLQYDGEMSWSVSDQVLTTEVSGGPGAGLAVDLTQYTLSTLAEYLAGQAGYTVVYIDPSRADLSATVLLDGGANQLDSNGDHLTGYTSLLWAFLEAKAVELGAAENAVAAAPGMLNVVDGQGMWLDEVGSYYGVERNAGEPDGQYGPRIIAEALRPRLNNIAIENAIQVYTGQAAQVVDVIVYNGAIPLYDSSIVYDGTHIHDGGSSPAYGLFDVSYGYDLINGGDPTTFLTTVRQIVERLRAAGTHLRALALQASSLTDGLTPPTDQSQVVLEADLGDALTPPEDAYSYMPISLGALVDALTAPDDPMSITVTYDYAFDGVRSYDGTIRYVGGTAAPESL